MPVMAVDKSGTIIANAGCVTLTNTNDTGNGSIQATGTWTGTIAVSGSNDGTNWQSLTLTPSNSATTVTSFTVNGLWTFTGAFKLVRACATAAMTGTATVILVATWARAGGGGGGGGSGTVTSVDLTMPAVFTVTGNPVTTSGTLAVAASGTSGGVPYFNAATTMASSGALTSNVLVKGGGAGAAPAPSLFTDNGTTATYTGTSGISAPQIATTGTAGAIQTTAIAAPATPAAGKAEIYTDSTTKTLKNKDDAGVVSTTVVADTGAANNFLTAISAGGVISKAQPAFTNISGSVAASQMPALTGAVVTSAGAVATTPGKIDVLNASQFAADAGASDTYAATLSPAITAYVTGTHYRFKANTANTGAATINFNAVGAITIVKVAGGITTALADNDIRAGQWVELVYDGTNMQMQSTLGNSATGLGYVITLGAVSTFSPADSTTYYLGCRFGGTGGSTTEANIVCHVPKTGTIRRWDFYQNTSTTQGSSENVTVDVFVNSTTSVGSTTMIWDAVANTIVHATSTGLSTAVTAGDTITFREQTPAWATNPTGVSLYGYIYID